MARAAAVLAWTQTDTQKVSRNQVLDLVEQFLAGTDEDADDEDEDEPDESDEEAMAKRREVAERKLMQMFGHPELPKSVSHGDAETRRDGDQ